MRAAAEMGQQVRGCPGVKGSPCGLSDSQHSLSGTFTLKRFPRSFLKFKDGVVLPPPFVSLFFLLISFSIHSLLSKLVLSPSHTVSMRLCLRAQDKCISRSGSQEHTPPQDEICLRPG